MSNRAWRASGEQVNAVGDKRQEQGHGDGEDTETRMRR
jgi:hypothetical protein